MKQAIKTNNCKVILQNNFKKSKAIPSLYYFQRWVNLVLGLQTKSCSEITIRLVNNTESAELNKTYRHKSGPTNILSFPFEVPNHIKLPKLFLGDLVICVPLVIQEAKEQGKLLLAHWAHLVIHGTLHLLGHDHIKNKDADIMENIEIKLLNKLGYPNPYK